MTTCQLAIACDLRPETPQTVLDRWSYAGYAGAQRWFGGASLNVHCDVADDELDVCFDLLETLAPYSATDGFVGYLRVPWDLSPGLIYFRDGRVSLF